MQFRKGDQVKVIIEGRLLTGVLQLASGNNRSLAVLFDEGVPPPFGIFEGKQIVLLLREGDDWYDVLGDRPVEVRWWRPG